VVETFKKKPSAAVVASKLYASKPSKFSGGPSGKLGGKPAGKPTGKPGGKSVNYAGSANPKAGKPSANVSKQKFDPGKPKRKPV
jgi:hypothetical protein